MSLPALYLALVHHPVRDRDGGVITTAITNLDVHDIARSARSYGAAGYLLVTPIGAQRTLVETILEHWRSGAGARRLPDRSRALALVRVVASVEDAVATVAEVEGAPPRVVATAAQRDDQARNVGWEEERAGLRAPGPPRLLLFGTGHGLLGETLRQADAVLPPIREGAPYNHLSVRAAAAIVLDRLVGDDVL